MRRYGCNVGKQSASSKQSKAQLSLALPDAHMHHQVASAAGLAGCHLYCDQDFVAQTAVIDCLTLRLQQGCSLYKDLLLLQSGWGALCVHCASRRFVAVTWQTVVLSATSCELSGARRPLQIQYNIMAPVRFACCMSSLIWSVWIS